MTSVTWGNGESLFFLFVQLEILSAGVFDGMTIVQLKKGREKMDGWMVGWVGDFYLGLDLTRYITTFLYTHIHVFIYSHIHIYTYTPLGTW